MGTLGCADNWRWNSPQLSPGPGVPVFSELRTREEYLVAISIIIKVGRSSIFDSSSQAQIPNNLADVHYMYFNLYTDI